VAAYCAKADLVERFGSVELAQLTDETAAASPDDGEITKACDEASSLIDAYLSARYTVPLSPVPTMVRMWACAIARKLLWKDRAQPESAVAVAFNQTMGQIRDVAKGVAGLPDAGGAKPAAVGGIAYATPTAVFDTSGLLDA
jgi:phage gp36-like protein